MLKIKNNFTKFLFLFFALAIPATGCAMENSTSDVMDALRMAHYEACLDADDAQEVISWPGYIMGGMKDVTVHGMQRALEHPFGLAACGGGICLIAIWRYYVASGKDLKAMEARLNAHREQEWARVKAGNSGHATDTNKKLNVLVEGNKLVETNLDKADQEFGLTSNVLERLFGTASRLSINQDNAFDIMGCVVEDTNQQNIVCIGTCHNMTKNVEALGESQSSMKSNIGIISDTLNGSKIKLTELVKKMRKDGKDNDEIKKEVQSLGVQVTRINELLADNNKLLLSKKDDNNNNEEA